MYAWRKWKSFPVNILQFVDTHSARLKLFLKCLEGNYPDVWRVKRRRWEDRTSEKISVSSEWASRAFWKCLDICLVLKWIFILRFISSSREDVAFLFGMAPSHHSIFAALQVFLCSFFPPSSIPHTVLLLLVSRISHITLRASSNSAYPLLLTTRTPVCLLRLLDTFVNYLEHCVQ